MEFLKGPVSGHDDLVNELLEVVLYSEWESVKAYCSLEEFVEAYLVANDREIFVPKEHRHAWNLNWAKCKWVLDNGYS